VAPIIHKSRRDVARLFQEKLAATDEEVADVPQMTAFARRRLRAGFLKADMGISGGNFGVAETGSLCICTNEGNGRLTTTVPRVHVALMGIERIVPTLADLGVMLQVLGRSATGQKLTVYSNIITGPRRHDDGADRDESDGPDHLYIVLVDNGRSRLLGTDLAEVLYCIRCGACLNACPVYQEVGGHAYGSVYPGPVGAVLTPGLRGLEAWHDLPHASTLCGACREICPVRIDIPRMLLKLRDEGTRRGYSPAWITSGLWFFRQVATRPKLFRRAQALASFATRRMARNGWIRTMPGHFSRWTRTRDFPAFAPETFMSRWERRTR
jgi:L-lactate dehydrogenase complex protein LldF